MVAVEMKEDKAVVRTVLSEINCIIHIVGRVGTFVSIIEFSWKAITCNFANAVEREKQRCKLK